MTAEEYYSKGSEEVARETPLTLAKLSKVCYSTNRVKRVNVVKLVAESILLTTPARRCCLLAAVFYCRDET